MTKDTTGKAHAPNTPTLRVDVDVPALIALAKAEAPRVADASIQLFGYDSLGRLQLTLGTAGPHVMAELAQQSAPTTPTRRS